MRYFELSKIMGKKIQNSADPLTEPNKFPRHLFDHLQNIWKGFNTSFFTKPKQFPAPPELVHAALCEAIT